MQDQYTIQFGVIEDGPRAMDRVRAFFQDQNDLKDVTLNPGLSKELCVEKLGAVRVIEGEISSISTGLILAIDCDLGFDPTRRTRIRQELETIITTHPKHEDADQVLSYLELLGGQIDGIHFAVHALKTKTIQPLLLVIATGHGRNDIIEHLLSVLGQCLGRNKNAFKVIRSETGGGFDERDDYSGKIIRKALQVYRETWCTDERVSRISAAWTELAKCVEIGQWNPDPDPDRKDLFYSLFYSPGWHNRYEWTAAKYENCDKEAVGASIQRFVNVFSDPIFAAPFAISIPSAPDAFELCWQLPCLMALSHNRLHRGILLAALHLTDSKYNEVIITDLPANWQIHLDVESQDEELIRDAACKILVALHILTGVEEGFRFARAELPRGDKNSFRIVLSGTLQGSYIDSVVAILVDTPGARMKRGHRGRPGEFIQACTWLRETAARFGLERIGRGSEIELAIEFREMELN